MALAYQAPSALLQPLIQRDRISYHKLNSVGWMPRVPRRAQGVRSTRAVRMQVGDANSAPRDQSTSSCSEIEDDDGISDALTLLQRQIKVYTANEVEPNVFVDLKHFRRGHQVQKVRNARNVRDWVVTQEWDPH